MSQPFPRALVALVLGALYTALLVLCNSIAASASGGAGEPWMTALSLTLCLVALPVMSIILPVALARRWGLAISWWPDLQHWPMAAGLIGLSVLMTSFDGMRALITAGLPFRSFAVHFTSVALFHVASYPLFLVLILGSWRKLTGLVPAMMITAAAFALSHLAQGHFFPSETTRAMVAILFVAFLVDQFLYLLTRSLALVALGHGLSSAVMLAQAGTLYTTKGALFWLATATLVVGLVWSLLEMRRAPYSGARVWLRLVPDD